MNVVQKREKARLAGVPVGRIVVFSGLLALAFGGGHHLIPGLMLEVALLGALVYVLAGFVPLRQLLRTSPKGYRSVAVAGVVVLVLGQVVKGSIYTFPVVGWTMYSAIHSENPVFYEYTAIRRSDTAEPFIPAKVIPTLANSRIDNRLKRQIAAVEEAENEAARTRLMQQHEATLRALARVANRAEMHDPIVAIQVTRGTVPMRSYKGDASILREQLWRIQIVPSP